jgi:Tol biopolymer transport system component
VGSGESCEPALHLVALDATGFGFGNVALSRDGKIVTFASRSSDHVAGDTNGVEDVFALELATKEVSRISTSAAGAQGNGSSPRTSISADGKLVAFYSAASNLVAGDTNGVEDIFVKDRTTGAITRVSVSSSGVQANGHCLGPSISADGRFVAFSSTATNLDENCASSGRQYFFLHDRETKQTRCETSLSHGIISPDGNVLVGGYATNVLAVGRSGGAATLLSLDPLGGPTDGPSDPPGSVSNGADFIPFASSASDLVPNDTNLESDIFVRDQQAGTLTRVSVASDGTQGDLGSYKALISGDGRFVAFDSDATNLVPGDTNGLGDVFVHDRSTGTTKRINVGRNGEEANSMSGVSAMSADGRVIVFVSWATTLVPEEHESLGVFVYHQW